MHPRPSEVAIVAIGRNESERLKQCLRAALRDAPIVVYVDSGSADGSAEFARSVGCRVVELEASRPFSAARARNEGFAFVMEHAPDTSFVQFVDGDCELEEGWIERATNTLEEKSHVGIVCGRVREIHPEASVFNRLCDLEWQRPAGELRTAGGRFMARACVFQQVGGFRPDVIAGEDDEFCIRVRRQGWKILMLDAPMASHDAAITSFAQWWRRNRRAGHAYAQVAALHGGGDERSVDLAGLRAPGLAQQSGPYFRPQGDAGQPAFLRVQHQFFRRESAVGKLGVQMQVGKFHFTGCRGRG